MKSKVKNKEEIETMKEYENEKNDIQSYQKLKIEISKYQQESLNLYKEIEYLKEINSNLKSKNLDLINLIKSYKSKEDALLLTEENLKNMKNENEMLKENLLKERDKFNLELRIKDNTYAQDITQTNLRTESLKHQVENFNGIKKLNDILYIKNNELKKNIEELEYEKKNKLEEMEIKYNKKMNNYKRKMIEFLKKNEKERAKQGTQIELNNKLNILHIQELVNEIEIQGIEVEDLLKERQELKLKILKLNRDLNIYQKVIDVMTKKNNLFQNKLKNIVNINNNKEYNSFSTEKNLSKNNNFKILSNNNQCSFNVMKLKKYKNLTKSEKIIKIIKEKYIVNNKNKNGINKTTFNTESNEENVNIKKLNLINNTFSNNNAITNIDKCMKDYIENKNKDDIIEFLLKEREKYKDISQFYKDKLALINNKYSNLMKIYDEILEKIYKEELDKSVENIIININDFKQFNFDKLSSEQKYAIIIKLINHISPLILKKDLENNFFIKNVSNVREKYRMNSLNSFNISSKNSTKAHSQINGIINLKSINSKSNDINNSLRCFSEYKNLLDKKDKNNKSNKNKTLYKFSNSKIKIDLFPNINLLDL